jgi:hypothetical protein
VFNKGVQAYNAGQADSAILYFGQAAALHPEPVGLAALGSLFANSGQTDSALAYYGRAAEVAGADPELAKERREALYNRAAVLYQARRWDEAITAFRVYLTAYPSDVQAMAGLASTFENAERPDSALAVYRGILQQADSAEPTTLFTAGAAMFNSASQPLNAGIMRLAARAFEAGLARAPLHRDGLYNAVNAYYLLQDSTKMLAAAQRLVALDPLNRNVLRLVAAAWQLRGRTDSTLHYIARAESLLVVDVAVTAFRADSQGATIRGTATNVRELPDSTAARAACRARLTRQGQAATARTACAWSALEPKLREELASAPVDLVFEALDAQGSVVGSAPVAVPSLPPGEIHAFELAVTGPRAAAWRYRKP